jgi:hypothetical protein
MENRINRTEFEKLVNKLFFEIENNLVDTLFVEKYRKLEELSLKVNLDKLNDGVIKKYIKIKEYYKEQDEPAFLFDLY